MQISLITIIFFESFNLLNPTSRLFFSTTEMTKKQLQFSVNYFQPLDGSTRTNTWERRHQCIIRKLLSGASFELFIGTIVGFPYPLITPHSTSHQLFYFTLVKNRQIGMSWSDAFCQPWVTLHRWNRRAQLFYDNFKLEMIEDDHTVSSKRFPVTASDF